MTVKKYDEDVPLLENKKVNRKYFKLVFHSQKLSRNIKPIVKINLPFTNKE